MSTTPVDNSDDIAKLDELTKALHNASKSRTLEEQVAYLKSQGIDPSKTYQEWDDDKKDD